MPDTSPTFTAAARIAAQQLQTNKEYFSGTKIHFVPDPSIFTDTTVYEYKVLRKRLKELAFLNKGLTISLKDEREGMEQEEVYLQNGGIIDFAEPSAKRSGS